MKVHGQKFKTKNRTKCGKWIGKLDIRQESVTSTDNLSKITCPDCLLAHRPGKV